MNEGCFLILRACPATELGALCTRGHHTTRPVKSRPWLSPGRADRGQHARGFGQPLLRDFFLTAMVVADLEHRRAAAALDARPDQTCRVLQWGPRSRGKSNLCDAIDA